MKPIILKIKPTSVRYQLFDAVKSICGARILGHREILHTYERLAYSSATEQPALRARGRSFDEETHQRTMELIEQFRITRDQKSVVIYGPPG